MERELLKISVRNLVEFILREGDIDNRTGGKKDAESMLAGARLHRKIQRRMGAEYHAEVSLKFSVSLEKFDLQVEGRADGIIDGSPVTIDEIKGIYKNLDYLDRPETVHLAQAKCYACIYGLQHDEKQMAVQMTYANLDTEQLRYFQEVYGIEELKDWFYDLIDQYRSWAEFQYEWRILRNSTIRELEFPYEYREGQKRIAEGVYRTILRKKRLFIQAPTGTGKTLSTVFPGVKAMGENLGDKIFYLTAKTITRTAAAGSLEILREQNLRLKSVILTAREKMCLCEEVDCNPEHCPYAKGHYDRVNDAVFALLTSGKDHLTRERLREHAEKWQVCPFEMSLDVSTWVDAIICDYNYAFDPRAHLRRFFYEGVKENYIFLVDEAHNLVERARTMYSAGIVKEEFLELRRLVKGKAPKLERALGRCNAHLLELKRECADYEILKEINALSLQLLTLSGELQSFLEIVKEPELKKQVMEFYLKLRTFLNTHELLDDSYRIYSRMEPDGRFSVNLFCIHPAARLKEYLEHGRSTIFFSATLLPIQYYKELLSGDPEDYAIYADSSFPEENQLVLVGNDVTSRYTRRGRSEYLKMAEYIARTAGGRTGNYLVFFPSYKMLAEVYDAFQTLPEAEQMVCKCQNAYMSEEEREEFLGSFEQGGEGTLLGFCVMGGIFSEGIDLAEERLIGAIIVGTGLPQVCVEREILKSYFDERGLGGFDYAYRYPGMNKVLQSAGRVIRTKNDRGCVVLLDERFCFREYQRLFPREWKQPVYGNLSVILKALDKFWN